MLTPLPDEGVQLIPAQRAGIEILIANFLCNHDNA